MSKPVKSSDLLSLDPRLEVVKLDGYQLTETVIWQAGKGDYSEVPIHHIKPPSPQECGEWIVRELLANERGHYGCYSSDTQVLTEQGWVFWPSVTKGTVLAAYNTNTGVINFEKPSAVQRWDYEGKMYHLNGQALDFLVSPDHRMVIQTRKKDGSWSQRYAIAAEEVYNKPVRYSTCGNLSESHRSSIDTPIDDPVFWSLVGFWIGDGEAHTSTNTLRFHLKRERKIEYLQNLCLELDLDFYPTENDRFVVSHPDIGKWMKSNCLSLTGAKVLPHEYLKMEKDCVANLLDGLRNSDGTTRRNTWAYATTSYHLASQLQALAAVNDFKFTCSTETRGNENHSDLYCLRVTDRIYPRVEITQTSRSRTYTEEWVDYRGEIHCATVSTGALIVRRNNKVAICGNCLEHPQITFSCAGFVHSVVAQGRTHRIGTSWDVQSQRYTGKRVIKVAEGELDVEDVFYVRPAGFYTNRQGKKYDWTEEDRQDEFAWIIAGCKKYANRYAKGMCEEHIRDYLAQAIRQNFVVSFNLRSILHFIDLRAKLDAQLEVQSLCDAFIPELALWAPNVWNYYKEKRLHKARLSP